MAGTVTPYCGAPQRKQFGLPVIWSWRNSTNPQIILEITAQGEKKLVTSTGTRRLCWDAIRAKSGSKHKHPGRFQREEPLPCQRRDGKPMSQAERVEAECESQASMCRPTIAPTSTRLITHFTYQTRPHQDTARTNMAGLLLWTGLR